MADAALFIGFGEVVRGREKHALRNYEDAIKYWNGLQEEGRIASYEVTLLASHAQLSGFIVTRGTDDQLDALRHSKDFRRQLARARLTLDHLVLAEAFTGERIAEWLGEYQEELDQLD